MAPKAKANGAGGASAKPKADKPATPARSGASTPAPASDAVGKDGAAVAGGRPDKAAYDAEQDSLKKEIDGIQAKLNTIRERISGGGKGDPADARRNELKAELETLRGQQANNKTSRGKLFDQLKALNEGVAKKIKDMNAAKAKAPYKSVQEIDERIKSLNKQIESGSMKIAEEKRAVAEISTLNRSRRTVETFQKDQEAIEADRAQADALRAQLDDPDAKAASERYDELKTQLDALRKDSDAVYAARNKLFDERTALQAQLDDLWTRKREGAATFRAQNDRYYAKVAEDRARRAERARAQRTEEEAEKRAALAERLREEASAPAFQSQIEDCQTLIDAFGGKTSVSSAAAALAPRAEVAGVPKLEPRQVESLGEGMVVRKKKGEDEQSYFTGKPKKNAKGGKKATEKPAVDGEPAAPAAAQALNLPFSTLSALLSMSIPPPASSADVPRVIEDLKTKKAWFEANQQRVTREAVAKAEAEIARLTGKHANGAAAAPTEENVTPANGGGEKPSEPAPTPQATDLKSVPVSSEELVEQLEPVAEAEAEVAETEDA